MEGEVRLALDKIPSYGVVEVFYNLSWRAVCDDNWGINASKVVCRQLGYLETFIPIRRDEIKRSELSLLPFQFSCTGNESNILYECRSSETSTDCLVAGVACLNVTSKLSVCNCNLLLCKQRNSLQTFNLKHVQ